MELRSCWRQRLSILGACFIQLTLGNIFTIGNLSPYLMSYLKNRVDSQITKNLSVWIYAVSFASYGLVMFIGGYLERRLGARITCLIGGSIFCVSVALSYFSIQHNFLALLFTYGFASCVGCGISYVTTVAVAMKWFPDNKGLASGVVLSFFGLGPLPFNYLQTLLINPANLVVDSSDGYFSDENLLNSVPWIFIYMALVYAVIQLVSICLLFPPNPEILIVDQKQHHTLESTSTPPTNIGAVKSLSPAALFKHKEFYMLWLTFAFLTQTVLFVTTYYKTYEEKYADDHFISYLGSGAAILNSGGRVIWGYCLDKSSYKTTMLVISFSSTVLMSTFFLTGPVGKALFAIWVMSLFFLFPGIMSIVPLATAKIFGPEHASINFGLMFTAPAVMSICGAFLISSLLRILSWPGTCITLGGLNLIAFLITLLLPFNINIFED